MFAGLMVRSQEFHFILLADTSDADIRTAVKVNIVRIEHQLGDIAASINLEFIVKKTVASTLSFEQANDLVRGVSFSEEDIVFFYYSGHGTSHGGSYWPRFLIDDPEKKAGLTYFNAILKKKSPRLLISMADCCNVGPRFIPKSPIKQQGFQASTGHEGLKALFLESKGNLICSSSKKGDYAYYQDEIGGFYTVAFCQSLFQVRQEKKVTWNGLMEEVNKITAKMAMGKNKSQNPQFVWLSS